MNDKAQTIQDLRATADVIEKNGLTKNRLYERVSGKNPPECPVCSLGGINVTVWGNPYGPEDAHFELPHSEYRALAGRQDAAERALAEPFGLDDLSIPEWNDAPGRTQAEVVAAFRAAADALEASK